MFLHKSSNRIAIDVIMFHGSGGESSCALAFYSNESLVFHFPMQHLLDRLRNYLGVVLTVKEAIDERANALIEYQTACCIYEDKVKAMQSLVQRAAGGQHPSAPKSDQVRNS